MYKPLLNKLVVVLLVFNLFSCGPNIEEIGKQQGDKYLKSLDEIDTKSDLDKLITNFNNTVYSNESEINSIVGNEDIEGNDKQLLDKLISDKISAKKEEINQVIQKRKIEGFNFSKGKIWLTQNQDEKDFYKALFTIKDDKLVFNNIKGEYQIDENTGGGRIKVGDNEVTFEKLNDSDLKITFGSNSAIFKEPTESNLVLGSYSGKSSGVYFTLNIKSAEKASMVAKGPGGSDSYPLSIKSKGNGNYNFIDRSGTFRFKYSDNYFRGKISYLNLNLKRNRKETAYYFNSIFDGYTNEEAKKNKSKESSN